MARRNGGIFDTLSNGKTAVSVISSFLAVDGAKTPAERLTAFAVLLEKLAANTDNVHLDNLSAIVIAAKNSPACVAPLQKLVDSLFQTKP
jgi:serine/threonine protein phosphatase PrpC